MAKRLTRDSLMAVSAVFVLTYAVLEASVLAVAVRGGLEPLQAWTTRTVGGMLHWIGISAGVTGTQILLQNHILQVDIDCTGIALIVLYSALIVAYPLSWPTRLAGLLVGIPLLAGANLVRLIGVAVASEHLSAGTFAFVHDYLFMVAMVLAVVGVWVIWLAAARVYAART